MVERKTTRRAHNFKDIAGQRFGRLTAIEPLARAPKTRQMWRCQCDCGGTVVTAGSSLRRGITRSCGCIRRESAIDLAGQRFGRLVAIKLSSEGNDGAMWHCLCDCGAETVTRGQFLRTGRAQSCGCLQRYTASVLSFKHGHAKQPARSSIYSTWSGIIDRCTNPNNRAFKNYGGRGIGICDRWRFSFEAFLQDMGEKPSQAHSIDRIDNDGNYEPGNCRWATRDQQNTNKRPRARSQA